MAKVPAAPRPLRTYDADRSEILAEQARLAREKAPRQPGSVQSTDGSVIRIPGPLDDVGRHGQVLTYDEDLHQPVWTPSSSGGIVDQAEIAATSGTVRMLDADNNLDYFSVTWDAPYRIGDNSLPDWLSADDAEPWRLRLTPGWYTAVMFMRLEWLSETEPPAAFGPYMGGAWDTPHNDYSIFPKTLVGTGRWGIAQYVNFGPFYHHADDDLHPQCRPIGPYGTGDSDYGQCIFTFTRLSGPEI